MSNIFLYKKRLRSFAKDDRGSFVILFGLVAVIVTFAAGMSIDYARATNEQARLQAAVDAAVLAGATQSQSTSDINDIENIAEDFFALNYAPTGGTTTNPPIFRFDATARQLNGSVTGTVPTTLTNVLGVETIDIAVNAKATLTVQQVEFVLAIDQSGSMLGRKQEALEEALTTFRQTLDSQLRFGNSAFVGIVPWQTTVNIGPDKRDWVKGLDRNRTADGINPNLLSDDDPNNLLFTQNTDRNVAIQALSTYDFDAQGYAGGNQSTQRATLEPLFTEEENFISRDKYESLSWRGCVLERDTNDTIPVAAGDNFDDFDPSITDRSGLAAPESILNVPTGDDRFNVYYMPIGWGRNTAANNWFPHNDTRRTEDPLGPTEEQNSRAPNIGCMREPMTYFFDLGSASQSQRLQDSIDSLNPDDDSWTDTDASLGVLWGLRMLSPDWRPFWNAPNLPAGVPSAFRNRADGTPLPAASTVPSRKVMILLTDGENGLGGEDRPGITPQTWSAYGNSEETLGTRGELSRAQTSRFLNVRELRICELAKNLGVEVYTIAFDVSTLRNNGLRNEVESTLNNCASRPTAQVPDYSFEARRGNLEEVFETIARQSSSVSLTQ